MSETNQCDGCQRGLPVDTQGTHYDPAEAGVDAWSRYRIRCTRQRYAEPDPRDAEIARLRARVAKLEAAVAGELLCMDQDDTKFLELRAQLAAAQADNAALRGALEASSVDHGQGPCWCSTESASGRYLAGMDNHQHWSGCSTARAALATPAPGAPLLDAVRDMCADLDMLLGVLTYNSKTDPPRAFVPKAHGATFAYYIASLSKSLAAVRAVLPLTP